MVFDIYFHNDFDGRASAAIILAWLKQRGDRAGKLMPIDYSLTPAWLQPNFFTGRRPTIVVDYPYHPGAAMWFDHHPTTFKRADWQRQFRQDKSHRFESRYHSCAHQVYDALRKDFGFRPPVVIKKLIPWADIEDSAGYRSAKQAVLSREPAFRIRTYMDQPANKRRPLQWLITALGEKSLDEITKDVRVRAAYRRYRTSLLNAISFYRTHLKRQNGIAYIDLTRARLVENRFLPYYLYPDIDYMIALKKLGPLYKFSVGMNPWHRPRPGVNIGALLKQYGGGGHPQVGGLEVKTRKEADRILAEIIKVLLGGKPGV